MNSRALAERILSATDVAFLATCDGDQPLMQHYFSDPASPDYTLIEIVPESVAVKDAWELDYRDVPL